MKGIKTVLIMYGTMLHLQNISFISEWLHRRITYIHNNYIHGWNTHNDN